MKSHELTRNRVTRFQGGVNPLPKKKRIRVINRHFTGPAQEVVESSSSARIANIGNLGQYEYLKGVVKQAERLFIKKFYKELEGMHNTIDVNWVNGCKRRHQELFKVFTAIVQQDEYTELVVLTRSGRVYNLDQFKYAPSNFSIKGVTEDEDIIDVYVSNTYPKMYAPLFVAMFNVAWACQQVRESEPDIFSELKSLAFSLYERGGLYNETNPDDKEWKKQEDSTLEILTNKPTRKESELVEKAFSKVCKDIKEGIELLRLRRKLKVKRYVLEFCQAVLATENYCHSPYTDDDLYMSMAADAANIKQLRKEGIKSSLLKSAVEVDPLRGCEFDMHTGYVSHYNHGDFKDPWIVTMQIPNPGKFKTRAIHYSISAIQDRCAYIHNRLAALLSHIPSDCTKDQSRGIKFTLEISNPFWRENRNWPSVLAYDWSNATDKLWSYFQEEVLRLIFDDEIVNFWHTVSTCEKAFRHKDGRITIYTQENGQPQGLLGSFEAFALAHHIIMLMTMYLSNRESYLGSEFYRVLGDDSIICSITEDRSNIVGSMYIQICDWCNVPINLSKSTQILFNNNIALVEFAKVYTLDGKYFSPIPERLANRIGKHNQDYYALSGAFWGQRHGMDNRQMISNQIDKYYPDVLDNHLAKVLVFSGVIPSFADLGFIDPTLIESEEALKLALCYWLNKIKATFVVKMLPDQDRENLGIVDKKMKDALLEIIPDNLTWLFDMIEDPDHKLMKAIQQNLDKETIIRELLSCSEDQAAIISVGLRLTQDEVDNIKYVIDMIHSLIENPGSLMWYSSDIKNLKDRLKSIDRLNYRSVYKRDSLNSMVIRPTLETYKLLFLEDGLLSNIGSNEKELTSESLG